MDTVVVEEFVTDDMGYMMDDMDYAGDMEYMAGMDGMMGGTQVPMGEKLMSSWVFVGGVATVVLVIGVLLGLLSAKRKIKKGIDLYED